MWEKLKRVTGKNYRPDEVTKKDKSINPYTGKDNGAYQSEVISMGFTQMVEDPINFAEQDPAHFEFMLTLLRGSE